MERPEPDVTRHVDANEADEHDTAFDATLPVRELSSVLDGGLLFVTGVRMQVLLLQTFISKYMYM